MKTWQQDHLEALLHMRSEAALFAHLVKTASQMGFEFCAYGVQMPIPVSRPAITMFNNYPPAWKSEYVRNGYLEIDPTVEHGRRNGLPLIWSPQLYESAPEFWEEAQGHGLYTGWAQSARDGRGAVGMLTLARSARQIDADEIFADKARITWLSQFAHVGMSGLLLPKLVPESEVVLTLREKEVLRWTAEGKTAYEIGQILSVSERTVNFHINNVVCKFDASNKTQAAVKASTLGMLF